MQERRSRPALPSLTTLGLALALTGAGCAGAGCHVSFGRGIVVDGVRLEHHHEEVLSTSGWGAQGLTVESPMGDVRVERSAAGEADTITVEVYEHTAGDATAALEAGKLVVRSRSGQPAAVGDVVVRTAALSSLRVASGMGDVDVRGVAVASSLVVETGKGDVHVRDAGAPERLELSTGMGDVELAGTSCRTLAASTGMGDLDLTHVVGEEAKLSSGMGDVTVEDGSFRSLDASTGLGDVTCVRTTYEEGDLDSGMGRTVVRDEGR